MMKNLKAFLLLFVCACCLSSAKAQTNSIDIAAQNGNPPPRLTAEEKRGYPLGVGDDVEIRVLGEQDWNGIYTVDEDGKILMPFIKKPLSAACKTDRMLREDVIVALQKFIREPQVFVRVTARNSRPSAVMYGEVRNPQQFDMRRTVTLLELYSYTGGATEASNGVIKVFHTKPLQCVEPSAGDDNDTLVDVNNLNLAVPSKIYSVTDLREGKAGANPVVRPGDIIYFDKTAPVYVVGEVRAPQGIYIPERGLTLTDAIAKVQGVNYGAKKKDVRIHRLKPGSLEEREIISVNLNLIRKGKQNDVILKPYDIVEVDRGSPNIKDLLTGIAITGAQNAGIGVTSNLPMQIIY